MAEQPSNSNPFLGSEKPVVPEKPAETASEDFSTPPIDAPKPALPDDAPVSGDVIPTPASKWRHKAVRRGLIAFGLVMIIAGILYWWFRDVGDVPDVPEVSRPVAETPSATPSSLAPDTGTLALPDDNANYESENFKAGEIVIGGELQFLVDEDEVGALTVENIRGEAFTEKNKKEVKLVVTWTTNKLALASVRYSKGIGQTERGVDETDYSYNHSVIISGLDPASTYLYTIDASDRYGNRVKSEPHAVFTGARTVSLFDLIAGAIGEVFGWAVTDK
jgi:hypothetical protein